MFKRLQTYLQRGFIFPCAHLSVCTCPFSVERDSPKTFMQGVSCPRPVCTSVYQDLMKPLVCMCGSFVLACDWRCGYTAEVEVGCNRSSSEPQKRSFLTTEPFYFAQLGERCVCVCVCESIKVIQP